MLQRRSTNSDKEFCKEPRNSHCSLCFWMLDREPLKASVKCQLDGSRITWEMNPEHACGGLSGLHELMWKKVS